ncbi:MAG: alginate O-acetyltransferase AlgX-related protein [Verrucomicrobiales bacterium]
MSAPDHRPLPEKSPGPKPEPTRRRDDPGAPYPVDIQLSARSRWVIISLFLAIILLPGLLREGSSDAVRDSMLAVFRPGEGRVIDRLRTLEERVDDGAWTHPVRATLQTALYHVFREGNRKVLIGPEGWLFHRPGVQALTGRGPVLGPTHSVAKDPALKEWDGPIPVIREFAAQLQERGIRLILVPVPDKASLSRRQLVFITAPLARRRHPDWTQFVAALGDAVEVVDIDLPVPYLPDDTHWEPAGARAAAKVVAALWRNQAVDPPEPSGLTTVSAQGDLVASLGLTVEATSAWRTTIRVPATTPVASDPNATVVLLGDSNVNMYDDPNLPFHHPGAGFGSWFAASLDQPIHVIALNGGGATQVRQRFAALPDDVVRSKKSVIWVLAERDLFMDPAVARAQGVEWKRVAFNPNRSQPAAPSPPDAVLVVEATLRAKSKVLDLKSVNYPDAAFTAEFTVDRVVAGTYAEPELAVVLWNFRQRVVQPTARLTPGQKVRLTLVPWLEQGELIKTNLEDDFQRFDLPLLYAEKAEVVEP